ncbi:MAG: hypothetical protein CRN43_06235 [Candidatus Nephrothrix sp. EaCA]|nr:MAG: hypothetical protein CRN43_06235 [Candidatus Nephrothrix sp. EaCA]
MRKQGYVCHRKEVVFYASKVTFELKNSSVFFTFKTGLLRQKSHEAEKNETADSALPKKTHFYARSNS